MATILVIHDDPMHVDAVERALVADGLDTIVTESVVTGLSIAQTTPIDLAVLSVSPDSQLRLRTLRQIQAWKAHLPVLVLSRHDQAVEHAQLLEAGADGYLVVPVEPAVLLAHIHALLRRCHEGRSQLRYADLALDPGAHRAYRGERVVPLTNLELRLLRIFLAHPDQVLPKELLRTQVWGEDFHGTLNIVERYVKQLRDKLEAGGAPRLIHTVRHAGYKLSASLS